MIMKILRRIFGKREVKFIKHAKILFMEENEMMIDSPLLKVIRIYQRDELVEEMPYSSTEVKRLQREGVPIKNETLEVPQYITTGVELGKVDL